MSNKSSLTTFKEDIDKVNKKRRLIRNLELMLEIEKYEHAELIEKLKQQRKTLTDNELSEVVAYLPPANVPPLSKDEKKLLIKRNQLKEKNFMSCLYDTPKNLQVTVQFNDGTSRTFDIIKSIQKDKTNLSHPIIIAAIKRYVTAFHYGQTAVIRTRAENNLDRIFTAIKHKKRATTQSAGQDVYRMYLNISKHYSDDYFAEVCSLVFKVNLNKKFHNAWDIEFHKRYRETAIKKIKNGLDDKFPQVVHTDIIKWLESAESNVPEKQSVKGAGFRNAYIAWKLSQIAGKAIPKGTVKNLISKGNKFEAFMTELTEFDSLISELPENEPLISEVSNNDSLKDVPASQRENTITLKKMSELINESFKVNHDGISKIALFTNLSTLSDVKEETKQ